MISVFLRPPSAAKDGLKKPNKNKPLPSSLRSYLIFERPLLQVSLIVAGWQLAPLSPRSLCHPEASGCLRLNRTYTQLFTTTTYQIPPSVPRWAPHARADAPSWVKTRPVCHCVERRQCPRCWLGNVWSGRVFLKWPQVRLLLTSVDVSRKDGKKKSPVCVGFPETHNQYVTLCV